MDCSRPGLPVHYQLPELSQTHVQRVSDAIQPSSSVVPFSSCLQSFPASGSFPMSQLFTSGGQSFGVLASASGELSILSQLLFLKFTDRFLKNFYFILEYCWLTVLCWIPVYSKMIQLCVYIYLFFFKFFSHLGCYIILSRVPYAIE